MSVDIHNIETQDEIVDLFCHVVNISQPEHYYLSEDPYPIEVENISVGYCHTNGPYWAKCGPRATQNTVVNLSLNTEKLLRMDAAQLLAVLTHEAAHIQEGLHNGPAHTKAFWRCMAFLAWQMRENSQYILTEPSNDSSQAVSEEKYIDHIVEDPNEFTVDNRIETVTERRNEMAELMGVE